jgi:hypothetical protein
MFSGKTQYKNINNVIAWLVIGKHILRSIIQQLGIIRGFIRGISDGP